ncbi:MAG: regulatory protein RecX [Betaproteobacteria bacterium]
MVDDSARACKRPAKPLKARAIALLARREYSRTELRSKLLRSAEGGDVDPLSVDAMLDDLAALGYLSDSRFATAVVRQKSGGYSKRAIGARLKASGVAPETVSQALAATEQDDEEAMVALWRKRFGTAPANDREKARQVRFLQSRGFSLSAVFRLLRNPPGEEGAAE